MPGFQSTNHGREGSRIQIPTTDCRYMISKFDMMIDTLDPHLSISILRLIILEAHLSILILNCDLKAQLLVLRVQEVS